FILFFFAFIISLTSALVINPKITVPNSHTKWRAGNTYIVKWKTTYQDYGSNKAIPIPDDYKGTIKLGYLDERKDPYNEHLLWDDLASGFKLNAGSQTITLPSDLETKTSYIIVLMGDSGNASPKFTIQAAR
ncbi:uncharacterized protein BX663DRAFT_404001, partial [Cokeromyces recurvatus]|uniref:uncharacterized protein n=1 Tax=Cokeromyces recurvatus TaxID=90255 RepID=UPI00221E37AE